MATTGRIHINGEETLGHILKDKLLSMPINQREYAWTVEKHVPDLLSDLGNAIALKEPEYFLGSVVATNPGQADGRNLVIDGQQRLATTTMLIAGIRDYLVHKNEIARAGLIEQEFLYSQDSRTLDTIPHLILNRVDHEYFRRRILARPDDPERGVKPTAESHDLIDEAAGMIRKHVNSVGDQFQPPLNIQRLMDWIDFIRDGARVIWLQVPDETNGFVMFQTLNDRGLALSKADLLKNLLFNLAQNDRLPEVQKNWDTMIAALDSLQEEDVVVKYLRHLWMSRHEPVTEKRLYEAFRKGITSKVEALAFATDMAEQAQTYAALMNPSHPVWSKFHPRTAKHVQVLHLLGIEQSRPLMLAIVRHFQPKEVEAAFALLVSVAVRILIVGGGGAGAMEAKYSNWARQVSHIGSKKVSSASELLSSMTGTVPSDAEFKGAFAVARVSNAPRARYYLSSLERFVIGDPEAELVPNPDQWQVDLEHVVPKKVAGNWGALDADAARALCRRLGNLALMRLTANNLVGNEEFSVKKAEYAKSDLKLTADIATYPDWGATEIADRQSILADHAVNTWPLKTPTK